MSPAALERAFEWAAREGRLPRCVIVVNLYGQSADMDALLPLCERYGVPVLEDAAESLGRAVQGPAPAAASARSASIRSTATRSSPPRAAACWWPTDPAVIARARKLATQAREPAPHYEHVEVGFNYRMSNVLAGIGRGQLRVLDSGWRSAARSLNATARRLRQTAWTGCRSPQAIVPRAG